MVEEQHRSLKEISPDLVDIARVLDLQNIYSNARDPKERGEIGYATVEALTAREPLETRGEARRLLRESVEKGPEGYHLQVTGALQERASRLKSDYDANLQEIKSTVIGNLESYLADAKSLPEAVIILSKILTPEIIGKDRDLEGLTQEEFDDVLTEGIKERNMLPRLTARASVSLDRIRDIRHRSNVAKYIIESKDNRGNVLGYKINADAIGKVLESPVYGAFLYSIKPKEAAQEYKMAA